MTPATTQVLSTEDKRTLLASLTECQCIRQAIGTLGVRLARTKPGTKRHAEVWATMTRLENEAEAHSSKIRRFFLTGRVVG